MDRIVGYKSVRCFGPRSREGLVREEYHLLARIICDREDEINAFIPEEYWSLDATIDVEGEKKPILAKLYGGVTTR